MSLTTTPASTPLRIPPPAPTPPGAAWHHPRALEIQRRKQAATFDDGKFWIVFRSIMYLIATSLLPRLLYAFSALLNQRVASWIPRIVRQSIIRLPSFHPYHTSTTALLSFNIFRVLAPFFPWTKHDDLSDIPLTPRQRQLFGLNPTDTTPTPGSTYSTPPRYKRSTPQGRGEEEEGDLMESASSNNSSVLGHYGSSPLNRSLGAGGTQSPMRMMSIFGSGGSSNSVAGSGGLVRRAMLGDKAKRRSLGSAPDSPLVSFEDSLFGSSITAPSTPSPSGGGVTAGQRGVSVGLNNKWLYKRQHGGSPGQGRYI